MYAMKQFENTGLYTDLNNEEMTNINGGASWVIEAAYWIGRGFGALAKIQERNGDTGQWMS